MTAVWIAHWLSRLRTASSGNASSHWRWVGGAPRLPLAAAEPGQQEVAKRHALLQTAREQGVRAMATEWVKGMVHPARLDDTALVEDILLASLDSCILEGVEPLPRERVFADIDSGIFLEFVGEPVDDLLIDVFAAQVRVAVGRSNLDHVIAYFEH